MKILNNTQSIFKIFLYGTLLIVSAFCQGQKMVEFKVAAPIVDTVGTWLRFSRSYDVRTAGQTILTTNDNEYGAIAERLVYLYLHSPAIRLGEYFTLQVTPALDSLLEDDEQFVPRYGGFTNEELGVRMEHRQTGDFKVVVFARQSGEWRFIPSSTSSLSHYLNTLSYLVHGKLHAGQNKRSQLLSRLQDSCLRYRNPFILSLDCLVDQLKEFAAEDNSQLMQSLREIDKSSYQ